MRGGRQDDNRARSKAGLDVLLHEDGIAEELPDDDADESGRRRRQAQADRLVAVVVATFDERWRRIYELSVIDGLRGGRLAVPLGVTAAEASGSPTRSRRPSWTASARWSWPAMDAGSAPGWPRSSTPRPGTARTSPPRSATASSSISAAADGATTARPATAGADRSSPPTHRPWFHRWSPRMCASASMPPSPVCVQPHGLLDPAATADAAGAPERAFCSSCSSCSCCSSPRRYRCHASCSSALPMARRHRRRHHPPPPYRPAWLATRFTVTVQYANYYAGPCPDPSNPCDRGGGRTGGAQESPEDRDAPQHGDPGRLGRRNGWMEHACRALARPPLSTPTTNPDKIHGWV
jgi:hypothetical protein